MFQVPCCGRGLLMMQPGVVYKFAVDGKCSFGGKEATDVILEIRPCASMRASNLWPLCDS